MENIPYVLLPLNPPVLNWSLSRKWFISTSGLLILNTDICSPCSFFHRIFSFFFIINTTKSPFFFLEYPLELTFPNRLVSSKIKELSPYLSKINLKSLSPTLIAVSDNLRGFPSFTFSVNLINYTLRYLGNPPICIKMLVEFGSFVFISRSLDHVLNT